MSCLWTCLKADSVSVREKSDGKRLKELHLLKGVGGTDLEGSGTVTADHTQVDREGGACLRGVCF